MRKWLRALGGGVLVLALLVGISALVLMRDPLPRIRDQYAPIVQVAESAPEIVDAGHQASTARVTAESGLAVELAVKWPRDTLPAFDSAGRAVRRARPLIVILGGHVTGRDAVELIPDTHGTVVAAVSYPFRGNHRAKGLAVVKEVPAIRDAILDTPPALMLALDYLLARPDVDTSRVELVGVSLGAPFAVMTGALDQRPARVWSIHGAGDPYELLEFNLRRYIPMTPLRHIVTSIAYAFMSGPNIAPERWAPEIAPRRFVMVNATDDERMPRPAVQTLYDAAEEPKSLIWMEGRHVMGRRRDIVQRLINVVLDSVVPDSAATDSAATKPLAIAP